MSNVRMFPPPYNPPAQIVGGARSYSGTPGVLQDVPLIDSENLIGWIAVALSGTTAQRPTGNVPAGSFYIDTTLGAVIVFDGITWRSPITSALV